MTMTNVGAFLWIMVIVLLIMGLLHKRREESEGHEDWKDQQPDGPELEKRSPGADSGHHSKGCCG